MMKRQKERLRADKAQDKAAKKEQRRTEKATRLPTRDGEDPDLAGIIPGPHNVPVASQFDPSEQQRSDGS
jgi:hypothetical protein